MLQEYHSLIAEGIVEMINHKERTSLKAELPEENLIFPDRAGGLFSGVAVFAAHVIFHAQIPSFCLDLSAR